MTRLLELFEWPPGVVLILIGLVCWLLVAASRRRNSAARVAQKTCPNCLAPHPDFARFCRRCGHKV